MTIGGGQPGGAGGTGAQRRGDLPGPPYAEAIGDYVAGPNHVLPTARSARFSSGLGVLDFMKRTTMVACDADSLARIGPATVTLVETEGLDANAASVAIRLNPGTRGRE